MSRWSASTGLAVLVVFRFLFGVGEAGAYPNMARGLVQLVPALAARHRPGGGVDVGPVHGRADAAHLAVPGGSEKCSGCTGRPGSGSSAGSGCCGASLFALWFRNTPEEHPATNQAERDLIASGRGAEPIHAGVPWGKIVPQPQPVVRLRHVRLHQLRLVLLHVLPAGLPEEAVRRSDRHARRPDRDGAHGRRAAAGRGARLPARRVS